MAFRIGEHIVGGYLNNKRRHRVHGWLAFDEERGVHLEVIGDMADDLAGKAIEFEVPGRNPAADDVIESLLKGLQTMQIGAAGDMRLRIVKVPAGPASELMARARLGEPPPIDELPCLYLEWYSQNGRVVAEIVGAVVQEAVEEQKSAESQDGISPTPLPDENDVGLGITGIELDEFGNAHAREFDAGDREEDDPYGLFPEGLDDELARTDDGVSFDDASPEEEPPQKRSWDEVIPGIDPETKAMYEQWDEIYGGEKDELLSNLLDPPMQLPSPDDVTDEAQAKSLVLQIAASLARLSVALDLCEHFTMVRTYRWIVEEILSEGHVHPGQTPTGIVTHYSTWESCPQCEAEFEAEYERRKGSE